MKVYLHSFFLVLLLSCCTQVEDVTPIEQQPNAYNMVQVDSFSISLGDAVVLAQNAIIGNSGKSREELKVQSKDIISVSETSTRSTMADSRFYIINFENNGGFALVSTDFRTTPVLAYSDIGHLNINDELLESGLGIYLAMASEQHQYEIEQANAGPLIPIRPDSLSVLNLPFTYYNGDYYFYRKVIGFREETSCFTNTRWSYLPPYNAKLPVLPSPDESGADYTNFEGRCSPGTDVILLAQLMAFYQYPATINGNAIPWDIIATAAEISDDSSPEFNAVTNFIRSLSYDFGLDFNTYCPSLVSPNAFRTIIGSYGFNCSPVSDFNQTTITNSLANSKLVVGMGKRNWNDYGVTNEYVKWIIDGVSNTPSTTYYYRMTPPYDVVYQTDESNTLYHCNWGHGTNGVGYYDWHFTFPSFTHVNTKIIYNITPSN